MRGNKQVLTSEELNFLLKENPFENIDDEKELDKVLTKVTGYQEVDVEQIEKTETKKDDLELLLGIPLEVTVELGRTRKALNELQTLGNGDIVSVEKLSGEPVDVLVNNKVVAKGKIVVVDNNFGIRILDIIPPEQRIKQII